MLLKKIRYYKKAADRDDPQLFTMKVNELSQEGEDECYFHVYMMHLVK